MNEAHFRNINKTGENQEENIPEESAIHCDGVVKIYFSDTSRVMALQGMDFSVKKGEVIGIIGKSGSGKSTLLNMIGGLETPTAGKIYVNGRDLTTLKEKEMVQYRRKTIGFVWQRSARNLFPYMTVLENVKAPMYFEKGTGKERFRRAMMLLEEVGMAEQADKFPAQLSGGEQQRVAIAVALANAPSILLADEPTGAVDTGTADKIFRLFCKLNEDLGLTIVIVTHDLSLADKVQRIVRIADGKVSTEKIRRERYTGSFHDEYVVLDKANRLQLDDEILRQAGIQGKRVQVQVIDGRIVISRSSQSR